MSDSLVPETTAVVVVGLQNEIFGPEGGLRDALQDAGVADDVLARTVSMLSALSPTEATLVATPLTFTSDYAELVDPVGILALIRDRRLFQRGSDGASSVSALEPMSPRLAQVEGRRGLNAFVGTELESVLSSAGVRDVVVAGALTALCVDSTARSAVDRGFRVTVLRDCTVGRSGFEQRYFLDEIVPMYARVMDSGQVCDELGA